MGPRQAITACRVSGIMYRIRIDAPWRYGGAQVMGGAMLNPGIYRVPGDLSEALAERAIAEGAAVIEPEGVTVEGMPKAVLKKGKMGRPRKGKSLGWAPENK
jgi:hypothetical protein